MVEPHAVFNNVVRTSSKACLAINKAMPEKQDDVEAHMYPTLPMETIKKIALMHWWNLWLKIPFFNPSFITKFEKSRHQCTIAILKN